MRAGQRCSKVPSPFSALSFAFEYAIPEEAPTGTWTLIATDVLAPDTAVARPVQNDEEGDYGENRSRVQRGQPKIVIEESFRVEAFKPASFEVHVTPEKPSYFANETFKAVIDGWYLFGAPMTEADVDWTLRLSPSSYSPPGFDEFSFGSGWWDESARQG